MKAHPQISTAHVTTRKQFLDNARNRREWKGCGSAARQPRCIHANKPAFHIDQSPAGEAVIDVHIRTNEGVDLAASPGSPCASGSAHHPKAGAHSIRSPASQ